MAEVSAREAKRIADEAAAVNEALQAETVSAFQKLFAGAGGAEDAAIARDYLRKWCGAAPDSPVPTFDALSGRNTDYNLGRLAAWQHLDFILNFDLDGEGDLARQSQDARRRRRERRQPDTDHAPEGDGDGQE